jgi:hypothetical protein
MLARTIDREKEAPERPLSPRNEHSGEMGSVETLLRSGVMPQPKDLIVIFDERPWTESEIERFETTVAEKRAKRSAQACTPYPSISASRKI